MSKNDIYVCLIRKSSESLETGNPGVGIGGAGFKGMSESISFYFYLFLWCLPYNIALARPTNKITEPVVHVVGESYM